MNIFYVGAAIVSILLAVAGYFFVLSVKKLIEMKSIKFEIAKPEYLKRKIYRPLWIKAISFGFVFLFVLHVYCGLLK